MRTFPSQNKTLSLNVPMPPGTNNLYANLPKGRGRVLSKAGRDYKRLVLDYTTLESLVQKWRYEPGQRLSLTLHLYFPDNRRSDVSNKVKALEDAIATALGFDDRVIDVLHVERKGVDPKNPRCEVSLSVIEETA